MEDCNRVVAEVTEQHGKIDILVNNAGITADHTARKMDRTSGTGWSGST